MAYVWKDKKASWRDRSDHPVLAFLRDNAYSSGTGDICIRHGTGDRIVIQDKEGSVTVFYLPYGGQCLYIHSAILRIYDTMILMEFR